MKTYYFPDDEYVEFFCDSEMPVCIDEQELTRLCLEWGEGIREYVHKASPNEIAEYGVYDTEPMSDAQAIIDSGLYDAAVALMDDDIREAVHADLAPCTEEEFLTEYMKRHEEKFGSPFNI